jgi:hypothetical protein
MGCEMPEPATERPPAGAEVEGGLALVTVAICAKRKPGRWGCARVVASATPLIGQAEVAPTATGRSAHDAIATRVGDKVRWYEGPEEVG